MIEGYDWVRTALLILGFGGLGICVSWAVRKLWPLPGEEDE